MKKKIVLALLLLSLGTAPAANTSYAQEISPPKVSRIAGKTEERLLSKSQNILKIKKPLSLQGTTILPMH